MRIVERSAELLRIRQRSLQVDRCKALCLAFAFAERVSDGVWIHTEEYVRTLVVVMLVFGLLQSASREPIFPGTADMDVKTEKR